MIIEWTPHVWHHVCLSRNSTADSFIIVSNGKVITKLLDNDVPDQEINLDLCETKLLKNMFGKVANFQLWDIALKGNL